MDWFTVDKAGLRRLIEKRGKAWVIHELLQNALDEDGVANVDITLKPVKGRPRVFLRVSDDAPEGFKNLAHAFTLFADSYKKGTPTKRGRWNLGEKLVLALCDSARISSTTGTVAFDNAGRHRTKTRTEAGSVFEGTLAMTRAELEEIEASIDQLLLPGGSRVTYNGRQLEPREPVHIFEVSLPTVTVDEEGNLTRTTRKTFVEVHEPYECEQATIYEMGIPVVELEGGDRYHYNVMQKVPLNMQRDNVTPAYLKTLRVHVLNVMHDCINQEDATSPWVRDAVEDERCEQAAVERSVTLRFGDKRAVYDPSDPEANKRLVSQGYTLMHGSTMSKGEWANVRRYEAAMPAGQLAPTMGAYSTDPDAPPVDIIDPSKYTMVQAKTVAYVQRIGDRLLGFKPKVKIVRTTNGFAAAWLPREIHLNLTRLGHHWFGLCASGDQLVEVNDLLLHEFGHHYESDHLSAEYHRAVTKLGAKLAQLALDQPELFRE